MSSQLDSLTSQFNILLNEYQDMSKKYTDLLNQKDTSLTQIPNYAFIGEKNLNVLADSNVSKCQNACSENNSCSGATFSSNLKNCTLYDGNGNMIPAENSVAIVKKAIFYSNQLKELNHKMSNLNDQIMNISNQNYNEYNKNKELSKQQEMIMINNHNILLKERKDIDLILRQFTTLNTAYEDGNIILNANYLNYIILLFVVLFLVVLLFTFSISSNQYGGGSRKFNSSILLAFIFFLVAGYFFSAK
jgi:NADH:ubiquinone oxidoreductase subunit 3 (subunit A)